MVAAMRGERTLSVQVALAALPIEQREVVVLHVFEELSSRAIGELCGCSGETAAPRWRYACEWSGCRRDRAVGRQPALAGRWDLDASVISDRDFGRYAHLPP
ncbi:MAG: hypothetical protein IPK26_27605 [Planctomycetes bacterium]|nr:hypothetical protein [Planctomycetota bacterium]